MKWSRCLPAFYSDDPSSNPAEVYNISVKKVVEKNENKKRPGLANFSNLRNNLPFNSMVNEKSQMHSWLRSRFRQHRS